ncbi:MAG: hypothetical protein LH617_10995 [Ramlibacter sp.]|nr:hypothetical protein [Ramlibacter sp.]
MKKLSLIAAAVAILATPLSALAESDVNTVAGPNSTASAKLDFTVVIPRVLFLQVGTGTNLADNTAVDLLTFTVPAASLGNGIDIVPTSPTVTAGAVTVRVFGNNGNISLTTTSPGAMTNATADTLPWSEIVVTATAAAVPAAGYLGAVIPHPPIPAAAGTSAASTITATNKVVRQEGVWTFAYDNTVGYAAGTYGTSTNNGRLTYTATLP